jgi:hypothetical protein
MIPETGQNNAIELYRSAHFPDRWEFAGTLVDGVYAVDATLLKHQDRWWLFATIESDEGSTWDTLHAYYADRPTSDRWTPHPLNPLVKDINLARPAGRIFLDGGSLIRPSQDCSVRYGYATNFNRIIKLTETEYAEVREHGFVPPDHGGVLAIHTFNSDAGLTAIDAKILRPRFWS